MYGRKEDGRKKDSARKVEEILCTENRLLAILLSGVKLVVFVSFVTVKIIGKTF